MYKCIMADPPWNQPMTGKWKSCPHRATSLPYPAMSLQDIIAMPIADLADEDCHCWLWTTNAFLEGGFQVLRSWGFRYLAPITWVKPSGLGNWFIHRTQTLLFGYKKKCIFPLRRYAPTVLNTGLPKRHSQKPEESYALIESISPGPRLELFARTKRDGWDSWGNEVENDISIGV